MRITSALVLFALVVPVSTALASGGERPAPPSAPPSGYGSMREPEQAPSTPRERAEAHFRDAWNEVAKGKKDLAAENRRSAEKHFRRALDRSRQAVELDSAYAEAWNLVGFSSRKLGDYPHAFAAYRTALRLKPDFALAREYYGEGLLERDDLAGAREQLAELRRIGDRGSADDLEEAVEQYEKAHPSSPAATGNK